MSVFYVDAEYVTLAVSVAVTFVLTVILNTSLLLLGYCILKAHRANSSKEKYVILVESFNVHVLLCNCLVWMIPAAQL